MYARAFSVADNVKSLIVRHRKEKRGSQIDESGKNFAEKIVKKGVKNKNSFNGGSFFGIANDR